MKKQSLFYNIICVLALTACSSSTRYVISGTVPEDLNGKYIYMLRNGNFRYGESNTNQDSAWVENGKFRFIGNVEGNAVRFISTSQQAFTFILEPGEIMFDITDEMSLKGTPLNDELTQYRKALKGVEEKYREINEAVKADPAFVKTERFRTMNEEARQMKKGICTSVIVKHKDNALGEYVLREWLISCQKLEEFDTAYDLLERRPVDFGPLKGDIMRWEEVRKSMPGMMFTDFTITDGNVDGTPVSLSDYVGKGKYVLVDFWASWCGWCRAEFPVLKEVYAKYKDQNFELLGIAVNDDREKTLKAMKEDGVTWPQILNTGKVAMEAYGIAGIPEIILFAPDGKILARGLRGDELKAKVVEVME